MSLGSELFAAGYRSVPFLYTTGTNTAGRKTVVHEFPNKTFRYVEDLGNNLRTFTITGLIKGKDWLQRKAALEEALTREGIGPLLHPYYGVVLCVCTGYTVTDDDKEIGVAIFEMTFVEARQNTFPALTRRNTSTVIKLTQETYVKVRNFIAWDVPEEEAEEEPEEVTPHYSPVYTKSHYDIGVTNHITPKFRTTYARNIQDAGDYLRKLVEILRRIAAIANAAAAAKAIFEEFANEFNTNAYVWTRLPDVLGRELPEFINSFDNLAGTVEDRDNINDKAFGFGEDETPITFESAENIEKRRNRAIINGAVNVLFLVNLYTNAVLIDYLDEEQLDAKIADLEDKYERLIFGESNILDAPTLDSLQAVRDEWRKFYENLRLTINKVIEIETPRIPLKILVYQYYGNIDNFDIIMQLNNINNPALVEGRLKILSQ
jgi:hypothetical protein